MNQPDLSRLRIERDARPEARPRGRGPLWLVAVAILAAVVAGWFLLRPRETAVEMAVIAATGGGTSTGSGITASGYVVARTKASVSAEVLGRLEYLPVSEGSLVTRGQVIARIESDDYRAALAAARARLGQLRVEAGQAQRDLDRAETLFGQRVLPATEVEGARMRHASLAAQVEAAAAQVDIAAASVENTQVRAPFSGTVLRKDAEVGEIVAPASAGGGLTRTAIVTMADLSTLEVEVDVNEAYIAQVRNGQTARITLDAYPDTAFAGGVRQVVPTADRQKATVQVKVAIHDRDARILPEMGAKVEFVRDAESAAVSAPRRVLVPAAAVVTTPEGARVWVVVDGRATARPVDVGPTRGDQIEVRRGLDGGETVVVAPPPDLQEGGRVRRK